MMPGQAIGDGPEQGDHGEVQGAKVLLQQGMLRSSQLLLLEEKVNDQVREEDAENVHDQRQKQERPEE